MIFKGISRCEGLEKQCKYTTDHQRYSEADVILFHMIHDRYGEFMPNQTRPRGQKWGSYHRESPCRYPIPSKFSDVFNFTVSYSEITDLRNPYFKMIKIPKGSNWTPEPLFSARSKPILWMVSHCKTQSKREQYVDELKKYIDIDIIGKCGDVIPCTRQSRGKQCEDDLLPNYFFYLAFENSLCEDYITEKAFQRMDQGLVPIVLGLGNYSQELPRGSYIDIKNFTSPRHLADYLKEVMHSEELYSSYHAWRRREQLANNNILCNICEYIYANQGKEQIIPDIGQVWNGTHSCIEPEHYYKGIFNFTDY